MFWGQLDRRSCISGSQFVAVMRTVVRYDATHQERHAAMMRWRKAYDFDDDGGLDIVPGSRARSRGAQRRVSPRFWQVVSRIAELAAVYALVVLGRMYAVTHWKLT